MNRKEYRRWKEETKCATLTREEFLAQDPRHAELIVDREKEQGLMIAAGSVPFADGRNVTVFRFERSFEIIFANTARNPPNSLGVKLSPEIVAAFASVASFMLDEADYDDMVNLLANAPPVQEISTDAAISGREGVEIKACEICGEPCAYDLAGEIWRHLNAKLHAAKVTYAD